ncbi:TPA: hypothetical protein CPU00_02280 [Candidatus Gastranaerophilales bacterium HUM_18]|nr:MAG TPA: hypothetical protein CPU00_02280 [Candidatus Gastranaerophilales bacterium HUM_18]
MPPILGFKTPPLKEKAIIKVKKVKRGDNIIIPGEIEDDYVDIVEEILPQNNSNFFTSQEFVSPPIKRQIKYLKNCYIIDYIQSPKARCGLGTEAIKNLAEKAMFDSKADGRIVTFSAPITKESSPALFFYKLGFRFTSPEANQYMEECIIKKIPDIPAQVGMMYLPKSRLHKLLRYGELF